MRVQTPNTSRGQVGIGVLVVFIAMILIAAMAASTLIHQSDRLHTKADKASEDTARQASGQLLISSASGTVTENETVELITVIVRPGPGSKNIDVSKTAIYWGSDTTADVLTHSDGRTSETFTDSGLTNEGTVLSKTGERVAIRMNATKIQGGLSPGESVQLEITTQYGATTMHTITAPESLSDGSEVPL